MRHANCNPPIGPGPPGCPAPWACDWGEDPCGLWQAFRLKGLRQAFRWCPPGSFLMGSPPDEHGRYDNETQHQVTLTQGVWMADTACTQALWQAVMGDNPSRFQGEQRPVERVSWTGTQGFIERLNKLLDELAAPLLALARHAVLRPPVQPGPAWRLRLPTGAEWEYACRAGTTTPFSFGGDIAPEQANYDGNYPYRGGANGLYREQTIEVGTLPPNPWGLYEMHGNVWEWCLDWYGDYATEAVTDPIGLEAGLFRLLRGGSWFSAAQDLRSACRDHNDPGHRHGAIGFRLALGPELRQDRQAASSGPAPRPGKP